MLFRVNLIASKTSVTASYRLLVDFISSSIELTSVLDKFRSTMRSNGTMTAKKVLVVLGATGQQGGSVARSVLGDPRSATVFSVRAVTRDPSKPSAQALTKLGAECVPVC